MLRTPFICLYVLMSKKILGVVKTRAKHARRGVIPLRPHVGHKVDLLRHKNIRNIFFVRKILLYLLSFCPSVQEKTLGKVKYRAKHAHRVVIPLRPHVGHKVDLLRHKNIRNIFFVCEILL